MSSRKKKQSPPGVFELFGGSLFAYVAFQYFFQKNPILSSITVSAFLTGMISFVVWKIHQAQVKNANLAVAHTLYSLSPDEFELAVAELFRLRGYQAEVVGASNDRGIDILIEKAGHKAVVQCKRYKKKITPSQLRDFIGAMNGAGVTKGYFVTTSGFTKAAKEAAEMASYDVVLVDGEGLGRVQNKIRSQGAINARTALIPAKWWIIAPKNQKVFILFWTTILIWGLLSLSLYFLGMTLFVI